MSFSPLDNEAARAARIRERLLADNPDIDERTLADTLEGCTNVTEMLAATLRTAIERALFSEALKRHRPELEARQDRIDAIVHALRDKVRDVMIEHNIKQLREPDFTASLRATPPKVIVTDETLIPVDYWELRPHLNKQFLLDKLKDGAQVDGAVLSNAGMSLSVRTK